MVRAKSPMALPNAYVIMAGTYLIAEDINATATGLAKLLMDKLNVIARMDGLVTCVKKKLPMLTVKSVGCQMVSGMDQVVSVIYIILDNGVNSTTNLQYGHVHSIVPRMESVKWVQQAIIVFVTPTTIILVHLAP